MQHQQRYGALLHPQRELIHPLSSAYAQKIVDEVTFSNKAKRKA